MDAFHAIGAAVVLIYVPHALKIAALLAERSDKNKNPYDIRTPRVSTANAIATASKEQRGAYMYVARCEGAHLNGFESFGFLVAAVLLAETVGLPKPVVDQWATVFVVARALYIVVYLNNTTAILGGTRSLLWAVQLGACGYLGFLAAAARRK